ncbi:MAG: flagellar protein FlgN [Gammaproteobacteria bacterium]|nr:MAG: flagellar protein FlgN [Gammaproteobacteria bacterium]
MKERTAVNQAELKQRMTMLFELEIESVTELLRILDDERDALMKHDPHVIEQIAQKKLRHLDDIEDWGRKRDALLRSAGYPCTREGIMRYLAEHTDTGLDGHWRALEQLLHQCQQQNEVNGGVVSLSRRHVQRALGILRGLPAEQSLYNAAGNAEEIPFSKTLATA